MIYLNFFLFLTFFNSYLSYFPVSLNLKEDFFVLSNGYLSLQFNFTLNGITSISSDFTGQGNYDKNTLIKPFQLEVNQGINSNSNSDNKNNNNNNNNNIEIIKSDESEVIIKINNIISNNNIVSETWELSLKQAQRYFKLSIDGKILSDIEVISISHGLYTVTSSIFGLFERGVFQMKDNTNSCLGSNETMTRSYFLGNNAAVDITISTSSPSETVFYSSSKVFNTGIQHVIKGNYPRKSLRFEDAWSRLCWNNATFTSLKTNEVWSINYEIGVNNMDFPIYPIRDVISQPNLPDIDIRTFLTGIYASPPGCLQSYYSLRDGTIAPTIATPEYGYSPNTNFFDPDNFISVSAMLFSGDKYLTNEVRKILERTAETMCGIGNDQDLSYCGGASIRKRPLRGTISPHPLKDDLNPRDGQLMHHYINLVPTYESIATSEQLGPNVFWTLSAIRYASVTGDFDWLIKMEPFLSLSAHFLLSFFDEDASMLLVPGPLWIDVLVRENYTSDSNAIVPYVFREFANVFDILHESGHKYKDSHKSFSMELRRIADSIIEGMNKFLWDEKDNDHYITQLNHDKTTTRDFIDYDSNLLAIAFDVAPTDKISKILTRVDSGPYTHIRGTWCSEIPYTGDACDCYIVGGSVCGDSIVTLGRIGWADAIARKKVGDLKTFEDLLLVPLQNDLIKDTWLYERYDSNGNQIRTAYYFEYPSLVAMMLTEIRYGLELNLDSITINPFQSTSGTSSLKYSFSFGTISLEYSQTILKLKLPGFGYFRNVNIYHLIPSTKYLVTYEGNSSQCSKLSVLQVNSNVDGVIQFTTPIYSDCTIVVSSEMM